MIRRPWMLSVLFAASFVPGWWMGTRGAPLSPSAPSAGPESLREVRVHRESAPPAGYASLLQLQTELEKAETDTDVPDAFDKLLADWTDAEFAAALDQALVTPECVSPVGRHSILARDIFGAWMRVRHTAAVAWIDTVPSLTRRDRFVITAIHHWPADNASEGIEFLLRHHWENDRSYNCKLLERALADTARAGGASAMVEWLDRLAAAGVKVTAENPSFPPGFDFATLTRSEAYGKHTSEWFQSRARQAWFAEQPDSYFADMRATGEWERFNSALVADRDAKNSAQAMRRFEQCAPEDRKAMLAKIDWSGIAETLDPVTRERLCIEGNAFEKQRAAAVVALAHKLTDPLVREEWVAAVHQQSEFLIRTVDLLETLPDPARRVAFLQQLHPLVDWRPDGASHAEDPANAPVLREAIRRWGVSVPPPKARPDPFADPFADPFSAP